MNGKLPVLRITSGILLLGGLVFFCFWLWSLSESSDESGQGQGLRDQLMRRKLAAAIQIRDGVTSGNFRRAGRGVAELRHISVTCNWYLPDDQYAAFSEDFRNALNLLDVVVSKRDASELPEAYRRLIGSCTRCHQQATISQIDLGLKLPPG